MLVRLQFDFNQIVYMFIEFLSNASCLLQQAACEG